MGISFAIVQLKYRVFWSVYATLDKRGIEVFTLCPPIFMPCLYCIVAAIAECCLARCFPPKENARTLGGSVCAVASKRSEASCAHGKQSSNEPGNIPLVVSAMVVVSLEAVEMVAPIYAMHLQGWRKAFVAGVIHKCVLFSLLLFMAEGMLKSRCFAKVGILGRPVDLFVHSNRLAKDLFTSTFLFSTLTIGVLLNTINEALCPTFNLHQFS